MSDEDYGKKIRDAFHRKPVTKDSVKQFDTFNEADHPRDPDGKFGSGGGKKEKTESGGGPLRVLSLKNSKKGYDPDGNVVHIPAGSKFRNAIPIHSGRFAGTGLAEVEIDGFFTPVYIDSLKLKPENWSKSHWRP